MHLVIKKYSKADGFAPCPFCGGIPELLQVPGEDYILRCSKCHASTRAARMGDYEALDDWNSGDIVDDHYSIPMDARIDDYLAKEIKDIRLEGYSPWDKFPKTTSGYLFSEAMIVMEDTILGVDPAGPYLEYDEYSAFNPELYDTSLAVENGSIRFVKSEWIDGHLSSLEFLCGNKSIVIAANADEQCMIAMIQKRNLPK